LKSFIVARFVRVMELLLHATRTGYTVSISRMSHLVLKKAKQVHVRNFHCI